MRVRGLVAVSMLIVLAVMPAMACERGHSLTPPPVDTAVATATVKPLSTATVAPSATVISASATPEAEAAHPTSPPPSPAIATKPPPPTVVATEPPPPTVVATEPPPPHGATTYRGTHSGGGTVVLRVSADGRWVESFQAKGFCGFDGEYLGGMSMRITGGSFYWEEPFNGRMRVVSGSLDAPGHASGYVSYHSMGGCHRDNLGWSASAQ